MLEGIDNEFYQLLKDNWLSSINFPVKIENQFFEKHAKRIFVDPSQFIKEARKTL